MVRAAFRILLKGGGGKIAVSTYQGGGGGGASATCCTLQYIYSKISRGEQTSREGGGNLGAQDHRILFDLNLGL